MWKTIKSNWFATLITFAILGTAYAVPQSYDRSLANVLVHEGYKYENVPGDPGGPTKYGITIYDVRKYLKKGATANDVRNLSLDDAKAIYRAHYWDAVDADNLPAGVDYSVFDYAVNAGLGRALPALRACQAQSKRATDQIDCIYSKRLNFQMGLPSRFNKFKRGWRNRIVSVHAIALSMAGVDKAFLGGDLMLVPRVGPGKAWEEEE